MKASYILRGIFILVFIIGCRDRQPIADFLLSPRASKNSMSFVVKPNNQWLDTGITINLGEKVLFTASGTITVESTTFALNNSAGFTFGPNGSVGTSKELLVAASGWMFSDALNSYDGTPGFTYALIGRVIASNGGKKFVIGSAASRNDLSGKLQLAVNTWTAPPAWAQIGPQPDQCSGEFIVHIEFGK